MAMSTRPAIGRFCAKTLSKQVVLGLDGGAKASFEYKVTRNGETLQEQTFSTVYRPWAAVYLRGTGQ
jgi:SAM-dependent MidA family methyltransferase